SDFSPTPRRPLCRIPIHLSYRGAECVFGMPCLAPNFNITCHPMTKVCQRDIASIHRYRKDKKRAGGDKTSPCGSGSLSLMDHRAGTVRRDGCHESNHPANKVGKDDATRTNSHSLRPMASVWKMGCRGV